MNLLDITADLSGMDCHIHSRFSPDANYVGADEPQRIADEVRSRGLRGFIVTDHLDVGKWDGYIPDFDKYFNVWEKVRRDNPDLVIYIGIEAGFERETAEKTAKLINSLPFEYVINSVHYWKSIRPKGISSNAAGHISEWALGKLNAYGGYLECVLDSLDAPFGFSAIGHLGFPERYAPYPEGEREMTYELFKPVLDKIIKKAVKKKIRFEENTNAGGDIRLPRADFLTAYKKAGGVRPVLGSDAHVSACIAQYFDKASRFLDRIF